MSGAAESTNRAITHILSIGSCIQALRRRRVRPDVALASTEDTQEVLSDGCVVGVVCVVGAPSCVLWCMLFVCVWFVLCVCCIGMIGCIDAEFEFKCV